MLPDLIGIVILILMNAISTCAGVYGALYIQKRLARPVMATVVATESNGDPDAAKECKACASKISARAKRCPYCTTSL